MALSRAGQFVFFLSQAEPYSGLVRAQRASTSAGTSNGKCHTHFSRLAGILDCLAQLAVPGNTASERGCSHLNNPHDDNTDFVEDTRLEIDGNETVLRRVRCRCANGR